MELQELLKEERRGSSYILRRLLRLIKGKSRDEQIEICNKVLEKYKSMAVFRNILRLIEKNYSVNEIEDKIYNADEKIIKNIRDLVKNKSITTISRSHTVEKGLVSASTVFVLRSEPKCEGIDTARYLIGRGVDVVILPDQEAENAIKNSDMVIVGADSIVKSKRYFVNKVGTLNLAKLAKKHSKPFYVAASSYKITDEDVEVTELFEKIPADLVTGFIWEKGISNLDELNPEL